MPIIHIKQNARVVGICGLLHDYGISPVVRALDVALHTKVCNLPSLAICYYGSNLEIVKCYKLVLRK